MIIVNNQLLIFALPQMCVYLLELQGLHLRTRPEEDGKHPAYGGVFFYVRDILSTAYWRATLPLLDPLSLAQRNASRRVFSS